MACGLSPTVRGEALVWRNTRVWQMRWRRKCWVSLTPALGVVGNKKYTPSHYAMTANVRDYLKLGNGY